MLGRFHRGGAVRTARDREHEISAVAEIRGGGLGDEAERAFRDLPGRSASSPNSMNGWRSMRTAGRCRSGRLRRRTRGAAALW